MAHDGRWTGGQRGGATNRCVAGSMMGNQPAVTRGRGAEGGLGKTAPTGGPRLPVTMARETGGKPSRV
jgi:hypothetical protein